jgi:murein DD-endopeptidase MepM/ murein hydrolase activator NlpD
MQYRFLLLLLLVGWWMSLPLATIFAQSDAPDDPPRFTVHVVQRGENLFRIALSYNLTTEDLARVNGILNPASIQVGQRLIIPLDGVVPDEAVEKQIHTVRAGESLFSIANLYNTTSEALSTLNELSNPDALYVGQELVVQAGSAGVDNISSTLFEAPQISEEVEVRHIIQSGETLYGIATQYGITVSGLQAANDLGDTSLIYAGQELVIPGVQPPQMALDLPAPVTGLDINPQFLIEGRSARVQLTTDRATAITGEFLGRELIVATDDVGTTHIAMIPVPVYTEPGIYSLQLSLAPTGAQPFNFLVHVQVLPGVYGRQSISLPDDRLHLLSPAVEDNETNLLKEITSRFTSERYFDGPLSLPAAAVMNSPFGTRRIYNNDGFDRFHMGADFAGGPGTPVLAAAPGRVVLADMLHIRGISVVIDHGWGVYTNYSHLRERLVNVGDFVQTGQTIGTVGNTGRATGAHLHWELWLNGVPVDPMQWVRQRFP